MTSGACDPKGVTGFRPDQLAAAFDRVEALRASSAQEAA